VVGNEVILSTLHHSNEYKKKGEKRVTKFFPHYNGPYTATDTHPETSTYTLEMLNSPNVFPTYHASELILHIVNDPILFPSCEDQQLPSIMTTNGIEEFFVEEIIDSCHYG
jgi:hypothetical protein